jgi:hypothetical protein
VALTPAATIVVDDPEVASTIRTESSADAGTSPTSTILVPVIAEEEVQDSFAAASSPVDAQVPPNVEDGVEPLAATSSAAAELSSVTEPVPVDAARLGACLESLAKDLPGGENIPWVATLTDEATVIHFGIDTGDGVVYSVSVDIDSCSIIPLNP